MAQAANKQFSMDDLPLPLLEDIVRRITSTSDLNSLSVASKQLYAIDAEQRQAIRVGRGLSPATSAIASLCSRFTNLCRVEINYFGWKPDHGAQLDNHGLNVLLSSCPSLSDLALAYCSNIDDFSLAYYISCCKKLLSLRLHHLSAISSSGLHSVAVGCKSLSVLHLVGCKNVCVTKWLEYIGRFGSLEELVVALCDQISQYDLLKFGPGWMRLQRFQFQGKRNNDVIEPRDPSYEAHKEYTYDFSCESLKSLSLAHIATLPEIGLRSLLGKCMALESLCLHLVSGLSDDDMIALSQSCSNLRSIKLVLKPLYCLDIRPKFSTSLTDRSLEALSIACPNLQHVDLAFVDCNPSYPSEISFTQEGLVALIRCCPIRVLLLTNPHFLKDEGMKALSTAKFLETLELMRCLAITDARMRYIARAPRLRNLTLRHCFHVTDDGVAEVVRAKRLESLTVQGCSRVSAQAVQGGARSVHYSSEAPSFYDLQRY